MKVKSNHFIGMKGTEEIKRSNGKKYTIRNHRHRYFFPDEWAAFYDQLKPKQKVTFHCLINTGARINEVRNIKVSDIDFERRSIVLRITKTKDKQGNHKMRIIPISKQFTKYLKHLIKTKKLEHLDNIPILSTPAANIGMKKALKEANINDWEMFSVHTVRKTLETWLISLDIDSLKIVKHFGHTMNIAAQHYVSPDTFSWDDKGLMRNIIGDLYQKRY